MTTEPEQALLNRTWRPTLSVTGAEGLPPLSSAGNVLRRAPLSLRLPPLVDAVAASQEIKALLEADAPYNAKVIFKANEGAATGWNAPASAPWLTQALDAASQAYGSPCGYIGQGGTIPLMSILQRGFPKAQFMVCGVLGQVQRPRPQRVPAFPTAKLTAAVAQPWPRCRPPDPPSARPCRRACAAQARACRPALSEFHHDHHLRRLRQRAGRNPALAQRRHRPEPLSLRQGGPGQDQIRYAISDATDAEGVLTDLQDELALLAEADPEQIDTTLLILPDAFDDFLDFNDFEEISNRLLKRMDLVGELQVATFHPQFQFADTEPDDIENCTNRSPYPILHLLREEHRRAVDAFPDAAEIYEKNIETMKRLGVEGGSG